MVKAKSSQSKQRKSRGEQQVTDEQGGRHRNSASSFEGAISSSAASPIMNATDIEEMEKKNAEGGSVSIKKIHNSRLLKKKGKAKKSHKRLQVRVAEKRGYTMCLKQLVMEEETVIQDMEAKLALMKMNIEIILAKNECIEQFIASMLSIF
ncbi:hypothetical protein DITRI_Ditri09bG0115600 [Diplodiscus trichospermus]